MKQTEETTETPEGIKVFQKYLSERILHYQNQNHRRMSFVAAPKKYQNQRVLDELLEAREKLHKTFPDLKRMEIK